MSHGPEGDERVAQMMRLRGVMKKIKHKIVVLSGKGGVGKSTVSVNLALSLALKGLRVGLLDTDIHGPNVAHLLGLDHATMSFHETQLEPLEARPNLFLVSVALTGRPVDTAYIWRGPIKIALINQLMADTLWPELDFLIIDSPPGTGDEPLTVCQLLNNSPSRGSIIVTTPQAVSVLDARRTIDFSRQLKMPILGLVENMSGYLNRQDGSVLPLFGQGGGKTAAEELEIPFLEAIPLDPAAVADSEKGLALVETESPVKGIFLALAERVLSAMPV
ncbi:MAG: Mrp/NBP35 family ATP-binding protein [Spirochaetales bacterium]|nr:Mrp/NBP35 family ATP-binding protein [Spirochaetales bacterium]